MKIHKPEKKGPQWGGSKYAGSLLTGTQSIGTLKQLEKIEEIMQHLSGMSAS